MVVMGPQSRRMKPMATKSRARIAPVPAKALKSGKRGTTPQTRANLKPTFAPKAEPRPHAIRPGSLSQNITTVGLERAERVGSGFSAKRGTDPWGPTQDQG